MFKLKLHTQGPAAVEALTKKHGPDALDVGPDKFLECTTVLIGENDGIVRIPAVLESVHGRTGFSSRRGGTPGLGSVHARLVRMTIGAHISIVHYCLTGSREWARRGW